MTNDVTQQLLTCNIRPTPYQDVNAFLDLFLVTLRHTLGHRFIALYLGGSLALGDFNPQQSDIDFVAVTLDELSPDLIVALEEMHRCLWATGKKWARKLDGSYVPRRMFRRWTADHAPCPFVERDSFTVTQQGSAVVQRHILHRHGVVVAGPSPPMLLEPVGADELRSALREMLERWWRPLLDDPAWLTQSQKQPFAILTLCRTLYTLKHGVVASKPVAARWCQQALGQEWVGLIEWALTGPHTTAANQPTAIQEFIQYILSYSSYDQQNKSEEINHES